MSKVSKDIILSYSTCTDREVLNKFQNILDSFWHKDEGLVFTKSVKDVEAGTHTLTFKKPDGTVQNVVIDIPASAATEKPISYITDLQKALDGLVKKVDGKGLSTNDFTDELAEKLAELQNYVHPDQHQMGDVEGLPEALATVPRDLQKLTEGGNATNLPIKVGGIELPSADGLGVVLTDGTWKLLAQLATADDVQAIMAILESPDTTLDELKEIVPYIKANRDIFSNLDIGNIAGLVDALAGKLNKTGDQTYTGNLFVNGALRFSYNADGDGIKGVSAAGNKIFSFLRDNEKVNASLGINSFGGLGIRTGANRNEFEKDYQIWIDAAGNVKILKNIEAEKFTGSAAGLTGFSTVGGNNIIGSGDIPFPQELPTGAKGQTIFFTENGSKFTRPGDIFLEVDIVETTEELNLAKQKIFSLKIVFEKWELFSHYNGSLTDFPSPGTQPAFNENDNELNQLRPETFYNGNVWSYSEALNGILLNSNFTPYTGFVSPVKYKNYNLSATLSSNDADDDIIGIILAYATDSKGVQHTLSVIRSPNLGGSVFPDLRAYAVYLDYFQDSQQLIVDGSATLSGKGSWSSVGRTRISVQRQGDIISVKSSNFGSDALVANSLLTIDLSSNEKLEIFREGASIGFSASSQKNALINNIDFDGFSLQFVDVTDRNSPKVWELVEGENEYRINEEIDVSALIPVNRWVYSNLTKKIFGIAPFGILGGYKAGDTVGGGSEPVSPSETITPLYLTHSGNENIINWPYDVQEVMLLSIDRHQLYPDEYTELGSRGIEVTAPNILKPGSKIYAQLKHNPSTNENL